MKNIKYPSSNQDEQNKPAQSQAKTKIKKILSKLKKFYFPFLIEHNVGAKRKPGTRQINHFRTLRDQATNVLSKENPNQADLNQLLDTDLTTITPANAFSFTPWSVMNSLDKTEYPSNRRCSDEEFAELDLGCEMMEHITPLEERVFMLIQSLIVTAGLTTVAFFIANAILVDWLGMNLVVLLTALGVSGLIMWLTRNVFLPKEAYRFMVDHLPIYRSMKKDAMLLNMAKHKLYVFFATYDLSAFSHLMERAADKEKQYYFYDFCKSQRANKIGHIFIVSTSTHIALDVLDALQKQAKLAIEKRQSIHIVK